MWLDAHIPGKEFDLVKEEVFVHFKIQQHHRQVSISSNKMFILYLFLLPSPQLETPMAAIQNAFTNGENEVVKVLELQHQSFQSILRTDFL